MSQYFFLILVTSIWCNGFSLITRDGKLLYFIRRTLEKLPEWLYNPLLGCIPCMASVHGAIVYFFLIEVFGFQFNIFIYIFAAVSSAFLNCVLYTMQSVLMEMYIFLSQMNERQ